jgi:small GTP-binding protein
MNLMEYERVKFELAAILRSARIGISTDQRITSIFNDLFSRLAEDRFNLVLVGRFNRGKTSLMNAMLHTERLPMGVVPVTSVITTVQYGSSEEAIIEYRGRELPDRVPLDALADYVSQAGNPSNERGITTAHVSLPSELLRHGFYLIDTPGIGSSIMENTLTTEAFLPEADAAMLVTSYDSPLCGEEMRLLDCLQSSARKVFVVINKLDTISMEERNVALEYVQNQVTRAFGMARIEVFSVSARLALEASHSNDATGGWVESGLAAFEERLVRFLLQEKQAEFLLGMCKRVEEALDEAGSPAVDRDRLSMLRQKIGAGRTIDAKDPSPEQMAPNASAPRFDSCDICREIERAVYAFLCRYQHDLVVSRSVRATLVDRGGFCEFHTWQYETVASPRGTCIGFPEVLDRLSLRLREIAATRDGASFAEAIEGLRPGPELCNICAVHSGAEREAVAEVASSLHDDGSQQPDRLPALCLSHLGSVVASAEDEQTAKRLLTTQAAAFSRVSEDMHRRVVKCDGLRRSLMSAEEERADQRGLMLLAGHRNVHGLRNPRGHF